MIYYAECQMNGDLPPPKNIKEQWITYVILNSAVPQRGLIHNAPSFVNNTIAECMEIVAETYP